MANKRIEDIIADLSDTQKETLNALQTGRPESDVNMGTVTSLDERDLVNRIQYTSVRSAISVPGWALSEDGNQVVEAMKRANVLDSAERRVDRSLDVTNSNKSARSTPKNSSKEK